MIVPDLFNDFENIKNTAIYKTFLRQGCRISIDNTKKTITVTDSYCNNVKYIIAYCNKTETIRVRKIQSKQSLMKESTEDISFKKSKPFDGKKTPRIVIGCPSYSSSLYFLYYKLQSFRKSNSILLGDRLLATEKLQELNNFNDIGKIIEFENGNALTISDKSAILLFKRAHDESDSNLFKSSKEKIALHDYSYRSTDAYNRKLISYAKGIMEMKSRGHFHIDSGLDNIKAFKKILENIINEEEKNIK